MATETRAGRSPDVRLWRAAVVFMAAVAVHGADHVRRGVEVVTTHVMVAGTVQFLLAVATLVLVHRRHPWAPVAAVVIGFASAIGFAAAHLLPHWSAFSDSFTGSVVAPRVTALSWASALVEIGADLALGVVGLRVLATDAGRPARPRPALEVR
ncbi:MAG: hypothetical protein QOE35_2188 [Actinomycetota bacterium]|jgi:hypothetical protein